MQEYLVSVALKKGIYAFAKGIVAFSVSTKMIVYEKQFGITIDPTVFQTAVGSTLFAIEHMIHDWLKVRFPDATWL